MSSDNKEIQVLQTKLKEARDNYYNLSPSITDDEYDALKEKLEKLDPKNIEVTTVGAEVPKISVWDKVTHEIPMGSLNKVTSETEFLEWAAKHDPNTEYFMCHKLDGSSLELVYEDGFLTRGVTRGNGIVGEDITDNISQIPSVPKTLGRPVKGKVYVRGEVVMHISIFNKLYASEYANPRNTAAGKVRDRKNGGKDCKNLHFYGFELVLGSKRPKTEEEQFLALRNLGFMIPPCWRGTAQQMINDFKSETDVRDKGIYEIDGEVISINDISYQDSFGSHAMRPKGKIAWKFESKTGVTKMVDVKWQVGPTGRITPVAVVEPVNIGGVSIENISLHNIKMFRELQLSPGDEVLVSRKNDVIPYIEANLSK